MKKKYIAPESEAIRFRVEDVITDVLPLLPPSGSLEGSDADIESPFED